MVTSECGYTVQRMGVYGAKSELIPIPGSRAKTALLKLIPDVMSRFFTNNLKMGQFLVSNLEKK
jgi:hypothetical protein